MHISILIFQCLVLPLFLADSLLVSNSWRSNARYLQLALRFAEKGYRLGEVPVGAIIVDNNNDVLAASHNTVEGRRDATCHAEINCIREASQVLGNWRLTGCTLISTIRPCSMCLRVSEAARVSNIIYGAESALDENKLASPTNIEMHGPVSGFEQTCADMMKKFFNDLRLSSKV